jgi:hypothetical protein
MNSRTRLPPLKTFEALCAVLACSPAELLGYADSAELTPTPAPPPKRKRIRTAEYPDERPKLGDLGAIRPLGVRLKS